MLYQKKRLHFSNDILSVKEDMYKDYLFTQLGCCSVLESNESKQKAEIYAHLILCSFSLEVNDDTA